MFHFITILQLFLQFFGTQAQLDITMQDCDIRYYNPLYFENLECFITENNGIYGNFTITNDLPDDIIWRVSIIAAAQGEFIVPTGFGAEFPLCQIYEEPILISPAILALKLPRDECPPKPGTYFTEEFILDMSLFPDTFRANNYLTKTELFHNEEELLLINVYQRIV